MRLIITILLSLALSGCAGMLLGGESQAPTKSSQEDERKKR